MLLSSEQMKKLKRKNVSKDVEKSAVRIKADYSVAPAAKKREILEYAGQAASSIYRLYKDGNLNARVVLALASELNVTPFYYTGETDDKVPCTDDLIKAFLEQHGYAEILDELKSVKPKRKYVRKEKDNSAKQPETETKSDTKSTPKAKSESKSKTTSETESDPVTDAILETAGTPMTDEEIEQAAMQAVEFAREKFGIDETMSSAMANLEIDEAITLLKALFIRAKAGGNAADDLDEVKRRLLS